MGEKELEAYLGFSYFLGIGPVRFSILRDSFPSAYAAYCAPLKALSVLIGADTARKFDKFRATFNPKEELRILARKNIQTICLEDPLYPGLLKQIADPPICLFAKGNTDVLSARDIFIGMVGTRKPSEYGKHAVRSLAKVLVQTGCIIVSGLADGIDTAAHAVCLEFGGATVAVLGCGVDIVYPASNRKLYNDIISRQGLVISEFPPSQMVAKGLFISRNRIISGLSSGIVVVEGGKYSGALITARYAAEQGRDVFAVPSQIGSPLSEAPHLLIKQGAKLVSTADDILEEYGIVKTQQEELSPELTEEEEGIFSTLSGSPKSMDDLINLTGSPPSTVLRIITELEIKKVIYKDDSEQYRTQYRRPKEGASQPT